MKRAKESVVDAQRGLERVSVGRSRECYRGPWSMEKARRVREDQDGLGKAREGLRGPGRAGEGQGGVERAREGWRGVGKVGEGQGWVERVRDV